MFQTDFIHFLQSFDYEALRFLMIFISIIGTVPFVIGLILAFTFTIDFKRGLVLINVVAWTALFTFFMKEQFAFPRPINVDSSIETVFFEQGNADLNDLLPQDFFSFFSFDLLEKTQQQDFKNYGFPSGHVSVQVAFWLSLLFLFKKKWIKISAIAVVLLTMISRMYLGHHFLGDVIGGALLGLSVSLLVLFLIQKSNYLGEMSHQFTSLSVFALPLLLVPFANHFPLWILGSLIGMNSSSILIILHKNYPIFHVVLWKRILAGIIALALVFGIIYLNKTYSYSNNNFLELLLIAIMSAIVILGAIFINSKLYLIRFRF